MFPFQETGALCEDRRTVSTFHMRMVVSSDADAMYTPSVDHAMSESPFV